MRGRASERGSGRRRLKFAEAIFALGVAAPALAQGAGPVAPEPSSPAGAQEAAADRGPLSNVLGQSSSPYLLQHAKNPVAWQVWGPDAIERARAEDKPILLSIGYSTCYWCHVMERETFESEAIAELINEYCIPIKVDREQLPTVDTVYMTALQLRTGRGGWPLNAFLHPETLDVFYAGTYFPPDGGPGQPGFAQIVEVLGERWRDGGAARAPLVQDSRLLGSAVREVLGKPRPPVPVDGSVVTVGVDRLLARHDPVNGGFGSEPKFPSEPDLELLLEVVGDRNDAAEALERTLTRMSLGGIHDQLGGGFHRYSVDATWTVPHFEKMLYTQGQLLGLYADATRQFDSLAFMGVAARIRGYVEQKLTGDDGRLLASQDAEVDGREGEPYLWTLEQVETALADLPAAGRARFVEAYGLTDEGNFVDPHHPELVGRCVLHLDEPLARITDPDVARTFREAFPRLLELREAREQPRTDDTTLAAWSGLMASGLARGSRLRVVGSRGIDGAVAALGFVDTRLRDDSGRLRRSWRGAQLGPLAVAEDHAFLIRGYLDLHAVSSDAAYLQRAVALYDEARALYWDDSNGGWFDSAADGNPLLPVRAKTARDGALPCANSELLVGAVELARRTGQDRYLDDASAAIAFLSPTLAEAPESIPRALIALHRLMSFAPDRLPELPSQPLARDSQVAFFVERDDTAPAVEGTIALRLSLEIAEGYHVTAADPGAIGLAGLGLTLAGAGEAALDAALPAGEPFTGPLDDVVLMVLEGRVEIPFRIIGEVPDPTSARLEIAYQVCDDRQCLPPRSVSLRLADSIR